MAPEVTPELVRAAYRIILNREPESELMVRGWLSVPTIEALLKAFVTGPEFHMRYQPVQGPGSAPVPSLALDVPPLHVEWQVDGEVTDALLAYVKRTWTRLGQERPHWSVLSSDAFMPEKIAANEGHFFASGALDVRQLQAVLARNGFRPDAFRRVFEFGCGVGRVTPHLAVAFREVIACDVSESHMVLAREAVERAGRQNVSYSLADSAAFGMTTPFDLWFSRIVLQHNSPPIIALILRRALALLAPGGVAVFQVPTYAKGYAFRLDGYLGRLDGDGEIEMHVLPQPVVFAIAADAGCVALEVLEDGSIGVANWQSSTFAFHKPARAGAPSSDIQQALLVE
jgi:SAM-dependent methyltransferase